MATDKKTILIVDDEKSYRDLFRDKLTNEGFMVIEAGDGEEGLEIAVKNKPDLILLDLGMPKMDGLGMLSRLRQDPWGKNAKVIILTNISDNTKLAEAIKHDTFMYLIKTDTSIEELLGKIKSNLHIEQ